jgi:hypothetical protein
MSTVSRLAKSSMLVLLTATLTAAAHARGGAGGGGGHNGSNGSTGPSVPVHGSPVQSDARMVPGNGSPILSKDSVAHGYGVPGKPTPIVRDHRQPAGGCHPGTCTGEGGLSYGTKPAPGGSPPISGGPINDHRTGPQVHDHRSSPPKVTIKFP